MGWCLGQARTFAGQRPRGVLRASAPNKDVGATADPEQVRSPPPPPSVSGSELCDMVGRPSSPFCPCIPDHTRSRPGRKGSGCRRRMPQEAYLSGDAHGYCRHGVRDMIMKRRSAGTAELPLGDNVSTSVIAPSPSSSPLHRRLPSWRSICQQGAAYPKPASLKIRRRRTYVRTVCR